MTTLFYDYQPKVWEKLKSYIGLKVEKELSYDGYKKIADKIMQETFGHTTWERFDSIIMERHLKTVTQIIEMRIFYDDYQDPYLEITKSSY